MIMTAVVTKVSVLALAWTDPYYAGFIYHYDIVECFKISFIYK